MINAIYFGRDIHTADENKILYAMNDDLLFDKDVSLRYGFVKASMEQWLLQNLDSVWNIRLWDVIISANQKSPQDWIPRDYHGIVCHSILEDYWREESPRIIEDILNKRYSWQNIASLFMWTWLMWQVGRADIMWIIEAINRSKAHVSLYTLWWYEDIAAIKLWLWRKKLEYEEVEDDESINKKPNIIPLITRPKEHQYQITA